MSKLSATEDSLGELHSKVAKVMKGALDVFDRAQEVYLARTQMLSENPDDPDLVIATADIKEPEPNASLLSVMTKFLADNKISCAPSESKELSSLESILSNKKERRKISNVVPIDRTGT